jgi:tetratricopeptide (TPR) repeat protein
MLIARAREFLEERAEAEKWTIAAYQSAKDDPIAARLWFENVVLRFGSDREKAFEYILNKREFQPLPASLRLLTLRREASNGRPLESALEALNAMAEECGAHPFTQMEMLRLRNMFHYSLARYAESAEDCREGLKIMPRDLEFNNNLAYILAKHLSDPQSALKPAELAAELAPRDPAVLDTLGWVYYKLGRNRDADRIFAQAIQTSKTPDDFVPTYLHQAQSKNDIGDKAEAIRFIKLAKTNLDLSSQTIKDVYTEEIETLFKELTNGE